MNIAITTADPTAKPDEDTLVKAGGAIPIVVTFDVAPAEGTTVEIAFSPQSSSPSVLAYNGSFSAQGDGVYTATLDGTDTRLIAALSGLENLIVNCEVRWTPPSAQPIVCPNFAVTVQPPVIIGATSSDGGPTYVTTAMLSAAVAAINTAIAALAGCNAPVTISGAGTSNVAPGAAYILFTAPFILAAGSGAYAANITAADANAQAGSTMLIPIDFPASANPTVSVYDGTTGGTLLEGPLTNYDPANAHSFVLILRFDGAAWNKVDGHWVP